MKPPSAQGVRQVNSRGLSRFGSFWCTFVVRCDLGSAKRGPGPAARAGRIARSDPCRRLKGAARDRGWARAVCHRAVHTLPGKPRCASRHRQPFFDHHRSPMAKEASSHAKSKKSQPMLCKRPNARVSSDAQRSPSLPSPSNRVRRFFFFFHLSVFSRKSEHSAHGQSGLVHAAFFGTQRTPSTLWASGDLRRLRRVRKSAC